MFPTRQILPMITRNASSSIALHCSVIVKLTSEFNRQHESRKLTDAEAGVGCGVSIITRSSMYVHVHDLRLHFRASCV